MVDKKNISEAQQQQIFLHILFTSNTNDCIANVIIEAIVEKKVAKIKLFNQLATINGSATIFATNTSYLSITEIQAAVVDPQRVLGMHFFNPAPAMKLVEIVKGHQTNDTTMHIIYSLCKYLNKVIVI